jgi:Flp pilus assembly pilin Flp
MFNRIVAQARQQGQAAVEYALVIGFISLALVATAGPLNTALGGLFTNIGNALGTALPTP